jgi:hypothetical protein
MRIIGRVVGLTTILAMAACSHQPGGASGGEVAAVPPFGPSVAASSGGGTRVEKLTGVAIAGVVPEGQALADESRFASGGDTILTVAVKKVNLPDGTALGVTLDFTPVGSIVLRGGAGTLVTSLGHFAVSRDQVVVKNNGVAVLSGARFE